MYAFYILFDIHRMDKQAHGVEELTSEIWRDIPLYTSRMQSDFFLFIFIQKKLGL